MPQRTTTMRFRTAELTLGGFEPEQDATGPFVWTRQTFCWQPARPTRFARLRACYLGRVGTLQCTWPGGPLPEIALQHGWHDYMLDLSETGGGTVTVHVSPLIPIDG